MKPGIKQDSRQKFERRITEELTRIFTETDSFYFSPHGDITNTLQRQCIGDTFQNHMDVKQRTLESVDDRFFWNKHMLQDILNLEVWTSALFIQPICS